MNQAQEKIHAEALAAAKAYQKCEADLLEILQRADELKIFRALGYPSLFDYCVRELKLSEASTCNFINVARKAKEIPELKEEIRSGNLTVAKARKIVPVITKENQSEWIQKAISQTQKEIEREVAAEKPELATKERVTFVAKDRLKVNLGVSEELMKKLRRAQDLVSASERAPASLEQTLEKVLTEFLEHHDPVAKADRAEKKRINVAAAISSSKQAKPMNSENRMSQDRRSGAVQTHSQRLQRRPALPNKILHQVNSRDRGQCQWREPDGKICGSTRWVHLHHKVPVAQGGPNTTENLITLCSSHHLAHHENFKTEPTRTSRSN